MPSPWEIVTTPALLADVRAWAITSEPPYPATAAQLRDAAGDVAPATPTDWVVTTYPEGQRAATVSASLFFLTLFPTGTPFYVLGVALLLGDDTLAVDYWPPGFLLDGSNPKLSWPIQLFVMDGADADAP